MGRLSGAVVGDGLCRFGIEVFEFGLHWKVTGESRRFLERGHRNDDVYEVFRSGKKSVSLSLF